MQRIYDYRTAAYLNMAFSYLTKKASLPWYSFPVPWFYQIAAGNDKLAMFALKSILYTIYIFGNVMRKRITIYINCVVKPSLSIVPYLGTCPLALAVSRVSLTTKFEAERHFL